MISQNNIMNAIPVSFGDKLDNERLCDLQQPSPVHRTHMQNGDTTVTSLHDCLDRRGYCIRGIGGGWQDLRSP